MKEYVSAKILQFSNKNNLDKNDNYIQFEYGPEYFSIISCLYTFLIWVGSFLLLSIMVNIIGGLIIAILRCNNFIYKILYTICHILWVIGLLTDLFNISYYYHKNVEENLPILSSKIILNGLKVLNNFQGIAIFYRDYIYIEPNNVVIYKLLFSYNGNYFGGSWLMTYFLYSTVYYDKRVLKYREKINKTVEKREKAKKDEQVRQKAKEKLLKTMLEDLKGEEYVK